MGFMKPVQIIKIIESSLNITIERNIEDVQEFYKVEDEIETNINIYTKGKEKTVYISKNKYALSVEFEIINVKEGKGKLLVQHDTLRRSMLYSTKTQDIKDILKELDINMNITTCTNVAKYFLYDKFKYYKMDPISRTEYNILESIGMKSKLYAYPCSFKDYYDYDVNSMYSYLLMKNTFRFPITEGKMQKVKTIDKNVLGIYKLKIISKIDHRIFMVNEAYTTYDIELLDYLGYKYELASDEAYIYDKWVTGDKFFGYLKDLYKLRSKYPLLKEVMSATWGVCAKRIKEKLKIYDGDDEEENPEIAKLEKLGYYIDEYDIHNNKCVMMNDNKAPFKFDLARLSYFLCSFARYYLGLIISQDEIKETLVYVHTDGFRCKVPPEDIDHSIGDKMGQLKYKFLEGRYTLNKLNSMSYCNIEDSDDE